MIFTPTRLLSSLASWSWTCNGQYGGMNDACQAQPQSALCGTSDGQLVYSSPTSNFCGVFSTLSGGLAGSGPWNWTCVSTIGGAVIGCGTIGGPVDGKCGSANNLPWDQSKNNLCSQGDNVNFSGGGPWTWNCTGYLGGGTDSCSKTPAAVNGACGSAHNNAVYSSPPPGGDLCASGNVANFSGTGPWYWDCVGPFGGSTDSCFAKYQFCDTRVEPQFGFNSSIMKWQDRPLQDTGAWAYCVDGATLTQCSSCMGPIYNPNAPFQFYLSTSPYYGPWGQLSSTQCSIPHCGIQNGVLKNGTTVTCCKVLP